MALVLAALCAGVAAYRFGFPWTLVTYLTGAASLIYVGYTLSKLKFVERQR